MTEDHIKKCFEEYFQGLFRYAFTLVKKEAEAKDIVQSSFIKLWEAGNKVTEFEGAKAFLYTVVYRESLNVLRNETIHHRHHQQLMVMKAEGVNYSAEDKELKQQIHLAIQALPERCREVFVKVRMEGRKYREVAEAMGISEKTVETQMSRAVQLMRLRLGDTIASLLLLSETINRLLHE